MKKAFESGDTKRAISIMKTFKRLPKNDIKTISIAHECLTGKESFYRSLGINTSDVLVDAENVLRAYISK